MSDDALARYREDRERTRDLIRRIDAGESRHFDYDEDGAPYEVTDEVRERQQRILDLMDRLMPTLERLSSDPPSPGESADSVPEIGFDTRPPN